MSSLAPDNERCTATVHEPGRGAWSHRCHNRAKPGTDKCGIHTPKAVDRSKVEPTTEPDIATSISVHVGLSWPEGAGPITKPPFREARVQWDRLSATSTNGGDPELRGATGYELKKDGTRSQRRVDERFPRLEHFPTSVQDTIHNAFRDIQE